MNAHKCITLWMFILSFFQHIKGDENEEEEQVPFWNVEPDEEGVIVMPWTGAIILIGALLCVCGGSIGVICVCFRKCKYVVIG